MIGDRAPKLRYLRELYDEGVAAARAGRPRPIDEKDGHGSATLAHLRQNGYDDAQENLTVEAMI